MTYFEENIACKASIEGKSCSVLGKQQIPGAEYPVPGSDALLLLQPNLLGLLRSFTSVVLRFCDLQVVRSDSSGHSEMGERCYLFSRGQTEELSLGKGRFSGGFAGSWCPVEHCGGRWKG